MTGVAFLGWAIVCLALFALFSCLWQIFRKREDPWLGYFATTCVYLVVATSGFRLAFGSVAEGASAAFGTLLLIVPTVMGWHARN